MSQNRRHFLKNAVILGASACLPNVISAPCNATVKSAKMPKASWKKLPRWRGFNLLEKFNGRNMRFLEDDFRMIHDLGFNFVRLPMDYRMWTVDGDWRKFDEKTLREIDEAVEFGQKYGIHTMINFHRAPGYTVAKPQEAKLVWDDAETLDVCALHWRTFARRYAGIPAENVSFNLFNEPANVEIGPFMKVHRTLCDAIRAEDSKRLIICDGMSWGTKPTMELGELKVAQATRGYMPMEISHYQASWVGEVIRDMKTPPTWPILSVNGIVFNPKKAGISESQKQPSVLELSRKCGAGKLRFRVAQVSSFARLIIETLDENGNVGKTLFDHSYKPGPGEGDWQTVIYKPEWNCYQNFYHKDETVEIPVGTRAIQFRVTEGDWMSLEEIGFRCESAPAECVIACQTSWGDNPLNLKYGIQNGRGVWNGLAAKDREWHWREYVKPWQEWEKIGGVMVGEFGAFNRTPHDVVLRWMRDLMTNWKTAGWGWALWNFRGSIGVVDSGRTDVDYVDFYGHKLDKKMMDLLQEF